MSLQRFSYSLAPYIAHLRRQVEAGALGDDEAVQRYEAEAARREQQERQRWESIQRARLSQRHLSDAERVRAGELGPSQAWMGLRRIISEAPTASVLLVGSTGAGKTTAAHGLALRRLAERRTCMAIAASRFQSLARHEEAMEEAMEVDYLVMDELHRVSGLPDWIATPLVGLIDHRHQRRLQTVACATVPAGQVEDVVGCEVVDRFDRTIGTAERSYRRKAQED